MSTTVPRIVMSSTSETSSKPKNVCDLSDIVLLQILEYLLLGEWDVNGCGDSFIQYSPLSLPTVKISQTWRYNEYFSRKYLFHTKPGLETQVLRVNRRFANLGGATLYGRNHFKFRDFWILPTMGETSRRIRNLTICIDPEPRSTVIAAIHDIYVDRVLKHFPRLDRFRLKLRIDHGGSKICPPESPKDTSSHRTARASLLFLVASLTTRHPTLKVATVDWYSHHLQNMIVKYVADLSSLNVKRRCPEVCAHRHPPW